MKETNLITAQDILLDKINQICGKFGLNNIMAQLYAVLYMNNKPMSLTDMLNRLKISKGSVSVNIRALERYGVVRKVWVKGSRRDYYEAEQNISKVIMDRVKSMAQGRLSEIEDMLDSTSEALRKTNFQSEEDIASKKVFEQKLDDLRQFHGKLQFMFNMLNSQLVKGMLKTKTKRKNKREPVKV